MRGEVRFAADGDLIAAMQALGRLQRRLDGAIAEVADRIVERDQCERAVRLSTRAGCRDAADLLRRLLRVDGQTARRYVSATTGMHRNQDLASGEMLPASFPELSEALLERELSLSGFLSCVTPLQKARGLGAADRLAADSILASAATSRPLDRDHTAEMADDAPTPVPTTDELAGLTAHILDRINPDGDEPADHAGRRRRHLTIGRLRDGSVPIRGELLPEVAAQLEKLLHSLLNPKVDPAAPIGGTVRFRPSEETTREAGTRPDGPTDHRVQPPPVEAADLRSHAQKRHDALATILGVAAASGGMPHTGGAAPTLVASITADDFARGTGRARIEGPGYSVPTSVAAHTGCAGGVQRVLFDNDGAVVAISTTGRIFNAQQRRAIILRDRTCLIPGCDIPAEWCEIHHVIEYARGGPTHTDNGVPLCWHHHHTLGEGHWYIRMRNGTPEIRGPNWWDPYTLWRSPNHDYRAVDHALEAERAREPAWGGTW